MRIPRTSAASAACGVATVHEAQGRTGLLPPVHASDLSDARVAGSAVTVLCGPGDNLMIHAAIAVVQPGDVLVVATTSESTDGMFGELLAESCLAHGVAGLVIDAGVRDTVEITALGFPMWSKAVSAQGTMKTIAGQRQRCRWYAREHPDRPGDVIVGDADGVVVVPRETAGPSSLPRRTSGSEKEARTRASGSRPASWGLTSTGFARCSHSEAWCGATD